MAKKIDYSKLNFSNKEISTEEALKYVDPFFTEEELVDMVCETLDDLNIPYENTPGEFIIGEDMFKPKHDHAYIYGKRINCAEENTISKERLEEIKRDMKKYFEGDLFE
jgi:hypothetical protein